MIEVRRTVRQMSPSPTSIEPEAWEWLAHHHPHPHKQILVKKRTNLGPKVLHVSIIDNNSLSLATRLPFVPHAYPKSRCSYDRNGLETDAIYLPVQYLPVIFFFLELNEDQKLICSIPSLSWWSMCIFQNGKIPKHCFRFPFIIAKHWRKNEQKLRDTRLRKTNKRSVSSKSFVVLNQF